MIRLIHTGDIHGYTTLHSCLFLALIEFLNCLFDIFHPLLPFVSLLLSPGVRAPSLFLFRLPLFSLPPSFFLSLHLPTLLLECNDKNVSHR